MRLCVPRVTAYAVRIHADDELAGAPCEPFDTVVYVIGREGSGQESDECERSADVREITFAREIGRASCRERVYVLV